ncbi:zinc metalloproteinase nas-14-like [Neodiprion virginianus]|uniref:zinc metalloproteinase nas-14-like n=1 Tax=Neodiprion virginianus TaxID=2961670 RepID=UPI001EE7503A|nr:zinc metalloproteinase nas-14-like [Neodiprion virginianus]
MNSIILHFVPLCIIGFARCLPLDLDMDMTAGLRTSNHVDEGILLEGDIISLKSIHSKNLVREPSQLWPNKVFPYTFSKDFDDLQKFNVETALRDLGFQTCVTFRERTNEPTYVVFKNYAKICASAVGYADLKNLGGEMPIYVSAPGCVMRGQIQHEVLHSLGFWHEHARPDRNEYVTVHWENIRPGSESNFEPRTWEDTVTLGMPYDLNSVMHYGKKAFSKNESPTLTPKNPPLNENMGQRFRVSKLDIAKLNRLYECDNRYYKGYELEA